MVRLIQIISILLLLFFIAIPAVAAADSADLTQDTDIQPPIMSPQVFEITPKTTWSAQNWLDYGKKASMPVSLDKPETFGMFMNNFASGVLGGSDKREKKTLDEIVKEQKENQEVALWAYNQGLKKAGDDPATVASLYGAKGDAFDSLRKNDQAAASYAKAASTTQDNGEKAHYLRSQADVLEKAGHKTEAEKVREEAATYQAKVKTTSSPLPVGIIFSGLVLALFVFSARTCRKQ